MVDLTSCCQTLNHRPRPINGFDPVPQLRRTLFRLSQESERLSPTLFIETVQLNSEFEPGGSFSDVCTAKLPSGELVALKRLRRFGRIDWKGL